MTDLKHLTSEISSCIAAAGGGLYTALPQVGAAFAVLQSGIGSILFEAQKKQTLDAVYGVDKFSTLYDIMMGKNTTIGIPEEVVGFGTQINNHYARVTLHSLIDYCNLVGRLSADVFTFTDSPEFVVKHKTYAGKRRITYNLLDRKAEVTWSGVDSVLEIDDIEYMNHHSGLVRNPLNPEGLEVSVMPDFMRKSIYDQITARLHRSATFYAEIQESPLFAYFADNISNKEVRENFLELIQLLSCNCFLKDKDFTTQSPEVMFVSGLKITVTNDWININNAINVEEKKELVKSHFINKELIPILKISAVRICKETVKLSDEAEGKVPHYVVLQNWQENKLLKKDIYDNANVIVKNLLKIHHDNKGDTIDN